LTTGKTAFFRQQSTLPIIAIDILNPNILLPAADPAAAGFFYLSKTFALHIVKTLAHNSLYILDKQTSFH